MATDYSHRSDDGQVSNSLPTTDTPALPALESAEKTRTPQGSATQEHILARQREQHRRSDRKYRESLKEKVSPRELRLCRNDPLREKNKDYDYVVCRDCGQKHQALQRHVISQHDIATAAYSQRWNNPPLITPSIPAKISAKNAGKPRPYARGMKSLGRNVRGKRLADQNGRHATENSAPADDATFAECRLAGKSINEICTIVDLTHVAVLKRLKLLGFPAGREYLFLHSEPVAKKHFEDLCKDFDVQAKEIISVVGENPAYEVNKRPVRRTGGWRKGSIGKAPRYYYDCLINHLKRRKSNDILLARFANIVLDVRRRLTEKFCFDYYGGRKRIRSFRPSEIRDLPTLINVLRQPLTELRTWLQTQNSNVQPHEILNWICEQSRFEVARNAGQRFRRLMFLWSALKRLLDEKGRGWLVRQQLVNVVVHELLAEDYDAAAHAISRAGSGKVTASPAQPLGQIIRAEVEKKHGGAWEESARPTRKRGRERAKEDDKTYFKIGTLVENNIPVDRKLQRRSIVVARQMVSTTTHLEYDVVAQYHMRFRRLPRTKIPA